LIHEAEVIILLKDTVLNRALAASFYTPSGRGLTDMISQTLGIDGPGRELRLLDPPMVMALGEDELLVSFGAEISAKVLGRRVEADVAATAQIKVRSSAGAAMLEIRDINMDRVGMGGWIEAPRMVMGALDSVLRGYFAAPMGGPLIRELPSFPMTVPSPGPEMTSIDLHITNLEVHEGVVTLGMSTTPGETAALPSLKPDGDIIIRLAEPFLEHILLNAWEQVPHQVSIERRIDVPDYRSFLDVFKGATDLLLARGWKKDRVRIDRTWLEAGAEIEYGQPQLRLLEGGKIELLDCPLHICAHAYPRMEASVWAPQRAWERLKSWLTLRGEYKEGEKETLDLAKLAEEKDLHIVRALAHPTIGSDGTISVKIEELELDMELEWGLPSEVVEELSTWMMEQIAERFPPVKLHIPLDRVVAPILGVTPQISLQRLGGGPEYLDIHVDLAFAGVPLPISPLPRFLADRERMQVHRNDCPSAHTVPEVAKIGYYSLHEAIEQGYRGCPDCLSIYHHIRASPPISSRATVRQEMGPR